MHDSLVLVVIDERSRHCHENHTRLISTPCVSFDERSAVAENVTTILELYTTALCISRDMRYLQPSSLNDRTLLGLRNTTPEVGLPSAVTFDDVVVVRCCIHPFPSSASPPPPGGGLRLQS
jgi:hypothetical protein